MPYTIPHTRAARPGTKKSCCARRLRRRCSRRSRRATSRRLACAVTRPIPTAAAPAASAAALWLGRGGLDPETGRPLPGPAPHAGVAGGCVGCHRNARVSVERGAGHAFAATPASCLPCHRQPLPPSDLTARAQRLWGSWRGTGDAAAGATPVHAGGVHVDRTTPLGRAAWDVLLVLEDPAAGAHNPRYARELLTIAEPAITAAAAARARGSK